MPHHCTQVHPLIKIHLKCVIRIERAQKVHEAVGIDPPIGNQLSHLRHTRPDTIGSYFRLTLGLGGVTCGGVKNVLQRHLTRPLRPYAGSPRPRI